MERVRPKNSTLRAVLATTRCRDCSGGCCGASAMDHLWHLIGGQKIYHRRYLCTGEKLVCHGMDNREHSTTIHMA